MNRIDHTTHDHANTKAARALCRRLANQAKDAGVVINVPSITAPNGTVIREGDIVTLGGSKIERRVVDVTDTRIRAVRTDGKAVAASKWTTQLNGVKHVNA